MLTLTVDDLVYDPATHTTRTPDGREVPHVTAVLSETGVATDFEELAALGGRRARTIEHARLRGTAVHADCHAYDDDDLAWDTVHDEVRPFVEAWAQVREDKGLVPLVHRRERRVFNPIFFYTGIKDGLFQRRGKIILGDIKTGDPDDSGCAYQTAAYEAATLIQDPGLRIDERWAIWLQPGKRVPYQIINYTARSDAHQDFPKFCAFLTTYNHQAHRRRRT